MVNTLDRVPPGSAAQGLIFSEPLDTCPSSGWEPSLGRRSMTASVEQSFASRCPPLSIITISLPAEERCSRRGRASVLHPTGAAPR